MMQTCKSQGRSRSWSFVVHVQYSMKWFGEPQGQSEKLNLRKLTLHAVHCSDIVKSLASHLQFTMAKTKSGMFPPWHKHKTTRFHVSLPFSLCDASDTSKTTRLPHHKRTILIEESHAIWMISMKNQTLHSAPYLAKSFGALHHKWPHKSLQSGSLMVLAVKPLKRELELLQAWTSSLFHRAKNCLGIWMNKKLHAEMLVQ